MSARASVIRRAALVVAIAGLSVLGWTATRLWLAWGDIERVAFSPDDVRVVLESPDNPNLVSTTTTTLVEDDGSGPLSPDEFAAAAHAARRGDGRVSDHRKRRAQRRRRQPSRRRDHDVHPSHRRVHASAGLDSPRPLPPQPVHGRVHARQCQPERLRRIRQRTGDGGDRGRRLHWSAHRSLRRRFTFEGFRHIVDRVGGGNDLSVDGSSRRRASTLSLSTFPPDAPSLAVIRPWPGCGPATRRD